MAYLEYRPQDTLIQYTSQEGFRGILQSKCLWLSDLRQANDPRELDLGYEKIIGALSAIQQAEPPGTKAELLAHLIERLEVYFQGVQVFCCCFSFAADELPMWGAYGQNYSGLALGFRPTAILSVPARVQKVKYLGLMNVDAEAATIAQKIAEQVEDHLRSNDLLPWVTAGTNAVAGAIASKGDKWAYEKEVRLVYVQRKTPPKVQQGTCQ